MVEDQAIDRVYRIGQTKKVNVYRLTIANSIEERILKLQNKKRSLIEGVIGDAAFRKQNLTINELLSLFK